MPDWTAFDQLLASRRRAIVESFIEFLRLESVSQEGERVRVTGTWLAAELTKRGLAQLGRVVPILASPVVAYLNNRDLQRAGEAAARFYGTIRQLPRRRPASAV